MAEYRSPEAAAKLGGALCAKYQSRMDATQHHRTNIELYLYPDLLQLTRQALATNGRRLPPRSRARLDAFGRSLCFAVPESALPPALAWIGNRSRNSSSVSSAGESFGRRDSMGSSRGSSGGSGGGGVFGLLSRHRTASSASTASAASMSVPRASSVASAADASAGAATAGAATAGAATVGAPRGRMASSAARASSVDMSLRDSEVSAMPQIAPAELEARVESYISSMWMSDAASSLMLEAKGDSFRGRPKEAAEAERTAMHAVEESNGMADAERVRACCNNFVSIYEAPGAKNGLIRGASNMLSNISIRGLLTPLLDAFACEVLGIPAPDSNAKAQLETVVSAYEKQYSWWQSAETNASTLLADLLNDFVGWLRTHEESIVANCATEYMLSGIDGQLRDKLKSQVYYSANHFLKVFKENAPLLKALPVPLQPLLDHSNDMDEDQARKDMLRERFLLDGVEVSPTELTQGIRTAIHDRLAKKVAAAAAEQVSLAAAVKRVDEERAATDAAAAVLAGTLGPATVEESDGERTPIASPEPSPKSSWGAMCADDGGSAGEGGGGGGASENGVVAVTPVTAAVKSLSPWLPNKSATPGEQPEATTTVEGAKDGGGSGGGAGGTGGTGGAGGAGGESGEGGEGGEGGDSGGGGEGGGPNPSAHPHAALTEHLCMRTIHATSRTASGGDAFFIIQDLYGGQGVLVKQSFVTAPPIEVAVGPDGIVVKSKDVYEIYHEDEVIEANIEAQPLMMMYTTMTETIPYPSASTITEMEHWEVSQIDDFGHNDAILEEGQAIGEPRPVRRFLRLHAQKPTGAISTRPG